MRKTAGRPSKSPVERALTERNTDKRETNYSHEGSENLQNRYINELTNEISGLNYELANKIDSIIRKSFSVFVKEAHINQSHVKSLNDKESRIGKSLEELKEMLHKRERLELKVRELLSEQANDQINLNGKLREELDQSSHIFRERENITENNDVGRRLTTKELFEEKKPRGSYAELQNLKEDINKKEKIIDALNENSLLQEEIIIGLKKKLQDEKTLNKILTEEHLIYAQKIEYFKKQFATLEADDEILSHRHEIVEDDVNDYNYSELSRSKQKNRLLGQRIKQQELQSNELNEELSRIRNELDKVKHTEKELSEARKTMYLNFTYSGDNLTL